MSEVFLTFDTLTTDVVYTVTSMRWLFDNMGYFYVITLTAVGDPQLYHMTVNPGTALGSLFDKLDFMRLNSQTAQFTVEKTMIQISNDFSELEILIPGRTDIVTLV